MENRTYTCNICGKPVRIGKSLRFLDIIGMSSDYTQDMCICDSCDFIFTGNPFSEDQLNNRYKNFSKFVFDEENRIYDDKDSFAIRCRKQGSFINDRINDYESVLEIGPASGYNLFTFKKNGKKVFGIEPSEANCRNAKKNYDVDMFSGTFAEYYSREEKETFDLIVMSMVLEHIVNPYDFMKQCSKLNNKYMFIEVPTFDYKYIDEPYGMFCEEHVNCFTLTSLTTMMNLLGYDMIDSSIIMEIGNNTPAGFPAIDSLWIKRELISTRRSMLKADDLLKKYLETSEVELNRIRKIIDDIPSTAKLAVWGTGHHVSMLLANTNLLNKNIVKFYDSDVKKHSFKMVSKYIVPFNKDDIYDGTVDTILVATFVANIPICNILEAYRNDVNVVVLY